MPSAALPLQFILTGLLALAGGVGWLVAEPKLLTEYHYNPRIIALTHLIVLGWLCSAVMGAMYQLVPVALETELYSKRLARWQFVFHFAGFAGMVWAFRVWNMKQVGQFGSLMAVGVGLFVFNIARTLLRAPKRNVIATAIASALGWFSVTVLAGLSIAVGKCAYESLDQTAPVSAVGGVLGGLQAVGGFMSHCNILSAMHAHAHLGVIGLFTMLIVGVSYKLVPMFTLSEVQSARRAMASVLLLNVGLVGAVISILLGSPWKFLFAIVIIVGLGVYGWEIAAIVRARKRAALDWGVKGFLSAVGLLAPLSLLAAVLAWPGLPSNVFTGQLENLYGFLGLFGFVTLAILGMLHKIIPFLVWLNTYSWRVGRIQVPALADLYSARLQGASYWLWLSGLAAAGAGILFQHEPAVRLGAVALGASLTLSAANLVRVLSHLVHPVLKPFPTRAK
jgi:hypothetical protein